MERYTSPTLTARMNLFYSALKTALKIDQKCKNKKLPISWKRLDILQNPQNSLSATCRFYKEKLLVSNYIEKNSFCSKLNAIFEAVKMDFGTKFGAWVSFHTAVLQS